TSTSASLTALRALAATRGRSRRAATTSRIALIEELVSARSVHRGIPRSGDFSVAIRIEHLTAPAASGLLGFTLVFGPRQGLIVNLRIDPSEDRTAQLVEIHRFVRVVIELQMMRAVACFNQLPFLSLRIVVRRLPAAACEREPVG